ncbi:IS66 family transposase, partial [Tautonia sociabilis]
ARGLVAVGCWAHARRKFYEARTSDPERSHAALAWIGRLYDVEREAKGGGWGDDRLMAARGERSRPLLECIRPVKTILDARAARAQGGPGRQPAARMRRTDVRPIPSRRAISAWLTRSALSRRYPSGEDHP